MSAKVKTRLLVSIFFLRRPALRASLSRGAWRCAQRLREGDLLVLKAERLRPLSVRVPICARLHMPDSRRGSPCHDEAELILAVREREALARLACDQLYIDHGRPGVVSDIGRPEPFGKLECLGADHCAQGAGGAEASIIKRLDLEISAELCERLMLQASLIGVLKQCQEGPEKSVVARGHRHEATPTASRSLVRLDEAQKERLNGSTKPSLGRMSLGPAHVAGAVVASDAEVKKDDVAAVATPDADGLGLHALGKR